MKKFFEKNEVVFAVILIVVYVVGSSLLGKVSAAVGVRYSAETILAAAMTVFLLVFIRKNGLMKYYGLCKAEIPAAKMWFYIPPVLIAGMGVFFGVGFSYPPAELIAHTVCMVFAGFVEEVVFRGFLYRAMVKDSKTAALIVTSITFGIGHIVNLLNGFDIFDSVTQIAYAVGCGFMLVFMLIRSGSLLPCIAFHSLNNILTGFTNDKWLIDAVGNEQTAELIHLAAGFVVMAVYLVYIIKFVPKREQTE